MTVALALVVVVGWSGVPAEASKPDRAPFAIASVTDLARAKALDLQAVKAQNEGRFAEAADAFAKAWDLSGDPKLLLQMSSNYENAGDLVKALDALDWYRARAPSDEQASLRERRDQLALRLVASGA